MKPKKLPQGTGLVAVGAVAVVAAGGFLAESAPLARLPLSKTMRRLGEKGDLLCALLSHEQRRAFEEGFAQERHLLHGIRCFRLNGEGEVVPEGWSNGVNAWVDVAAAKTAQLLAGEPGDTIWRCRMAWALVVEAARAGGL
jgi:hypothetical protein